MPTLDTVLSVITSFFSFPSTPAIISLGILWTLVIFIFFSVWYVIRDTKKALNDDNVIQHDDYRLEMLKKGIVQARIHTLALRFCDPDEENGRILLDRSVAQFKKAMKGIRVTLLRIIGGAAILLSILLGFHWLVSLALAVYYAARESYHKYLIDVIASNPVLIMQLKDED